jgi:hypothetical protein
MAYINILLVCVVFLYGTTTKSNHLNNIVVSASVEEMTNGYLDWLEHHPEPTAAGKPQKILMPTLDLYSPTGTSIYFGTDSGANAAFVHTLPQGITNVGMTEPRPSLKEAIEMFSELRAKENALLADKRYTLFAVTYLNWERSKQQNEAVEELRRRISSTNIRIIEVRLHK